MKNFKKICAVSILVVLAVMSGAQGIYAQSPNDRHKVSDRRSVSTTVSGQTGTIVSEIYESMFKDCKSLKTVGIPPSVIKMDNYAFAGSGITEIDISSVTEFGADCFSGCKALKTVKLNDSLKEDFLMETYGIFVGCPLLEVKYVNDRYVYPAGFVFVEK